MKSSKPDGPQSLADRQIQVHSLVFEFMGWLYAQVTFNQNYPIPVCQTELNQGPCSKRLYNLSWVSTEGQITILFFNFYIVFDQKKWWLSDNL